MTIGERIKQLRTEKGITQTELADIIGTTKQNIYKYENGIITNIPSDKVEAISRYFQVSPAFLMGWNNPVPNEIETPIKTNVNNFSAGEINHIQKYRQLDTYGKKAIDDLLETEYNRCTTIDEEQSEEQEIEIKHSYYKVSAGTGFNLGNDDEWETIYIPDTTEAQKADFALTIQGDSMEPVYFDGDIVLVKEQSAIDIGQIGIFIIEGNGYIKKYGGDRLISLNAEYDDIIFAEHDEDRIRCIGKVIGRA